MRGNYVWFWHSKVENSECQFWDCLNICVTKNRAQRDACDTRLFDRFGITVRRRSKPQNFTQKASQLADFLKQQFPHQWFLKMLSRNRDSEKSRADLFNLYSLRSCHSLCSMYIAPKNSFKNTIVRQCLSSHQSTFSQNSK